MRPWCAVDKWSTCLQGISCPAFSLQHAAGVLGFVRDSILPHIQLSSTEDHDPPSPDLSKATLTALVSFCLAQAQECVFQRALVDKLKNGSIARIAEKLNDLYKNALENANMARGSEGVWPTFAFPSVCPSFTLLLSLGWLMPAILIDAPFDVATQQSWISHVTYKRYHFAAVAQYRKSVEDSASNRYGDELGRLYAAQSYVQAGLSTSKKGVSPAVIVDIKVCHTRYNPQSLRLCTTLADCYLGVSLCKRHYMALSRLQSGIIASSTMKL